MINRRGIIGGLIGLVAAPAIVRSGSLMPVKALHPWVRGGLVSWGSWVREDEYEWVQLPMAFKGDIIHERVLALWRQGKTSIDRKPDWWWRTHQEQGA